MGIEYIPSLPFLLVDQMFNLQRQDYYRIAAEENIWSGSEQMPNNTRGKRIQSLGIWFTSPSVAFH